MGLSLNFKPPMNAFAQAHRAHRLWPRNVVSLTRIRLDQDRPGLSHGC